MANILARRNAVYTALALALAVMMLAWLPELSVPAAEFLFSLGALGVLTFAVIGYVESRGRPLGWVVITRAFWRHVRQFRPLADVPTPLTFSPSIASGTAYALKAKLTMKNTSDVAVALESEDFTFVPTIPRAQNRRDDLDAKFQFAKTDHGKDAYYQKHILEPHDSVAIWVAVEPTFGPSALDQHIKAHNTGVWVYHCTPLSDRPTRTRYEYSF
jgi:hypothetical protein